MLPGDTPTLPQVSNAAESDQQQVMMRRLWKSDELIKQLKHIVKAQHGKIEELRERLESEPAGTVRSQMAAHDQKDLKRVKEDNDELRRHVHRVKAENDRLKSESDTMRKANSRLKKMLQQQHPREEIDDPLEYTQDPRSGGLGDSARSAPAIDGSQQRKSFLTAGLAATAPLPSTARSSNSSPAKRPFTSSSATGSSLPQSSKLWRLSTVVPMFWRDLQNPASVLNALVEIASRLLEDGPSAAITVYMLDSWLRSAASDSSDHQPALFYLGAGRTTVQVFRSDGARAEPPRFQDLQALPTRTRTALAVAVPMPSSHRKLAMVQVVSTEDPRERRMPKHTPKELQDTLGSHHSPNDQAGFTDSQLMHLQVVCTVAGGILEQLKDAEFKQNLLDHMRSCVDVSVAINQARSLPDFEQRVKHMLGDFFGVTTVRVLFFDSDTNELLISSAQMKRKGLSRISLDKGVVGLCAKRQQLVHVANISHHPYIDAAADGLQRSGRPISSEASMLIGPLVIENVDGARLVGVVQLLERRKAKGPATETAKSEEFSAEEQSLFNQLLRVCAQAAWRTYKVEELTAQVNNTPVSWEILLS